MQQAVSAVEEPKVNDLKVSSVCVRERESTRCKPAVLFWDTTVGLVVVVVVAKVLWPLRLACDTASCRRHYLCSLVPRTWFRVRGEGEYSNATQCSTVSTPADQEQTLLLHFGPTWSRDQRVLHPGNASLRHLHRLMLLLWLWWAHHCHSQGKVRLVVQH